MSSPPTCTQNAVGRVVPVEDGLHRGRDRCRQDGKRLTLAERWNGTTWAIQRT
jgi:hypothetical protein